MKKRVIITTSFPAIHYWEQCPIESVGFLRNPHRHVFHVTVKIPVNHDDRDIEFIDFKNKLEKYIQEVFYNKNIGQTSCEMICKEIMLHFPLITYIKIMEDNENGAEFEF